MHQTIARPPSLVVFRRILACCLLLTGAALPLQALALDTDGDGYDDAVDAFPNDPAAAVDTDADGMPDAYLASVLDSFESGNFSGSNWTVTGWGVSSGDASHGTYAAFSSINDTSAFPGVKTNTLTLNVTVVGTVRVQYDYKFAKQNDNGGVNTFTIPCDTCLYSEATATDSWRTETKTLTAGTYQLEWKHRCVATETSRLGGNCATTFSGQARGQTIAKVDNVRIFSGSTPLLEDTDDDNDGVLDVHDKFPLNAAAFADADNDGLPDAWLQPNVYGCAVDAATCNGLTLDSLVSDNNDGDNDGVPNNNYGDNCSLIGNADQSDIDHDGVGDVCDAMPAVAYAGSVDRDFNPGSGVNSAVYSIAQQIDGKLPIGGDLTYVDGVERSYIARLNGDGSLETGFNPDIGAPGTVRSVVLQADGKLLIGGAFTTVNGVVLNRIARLNNDGSLDTSFNPGNGANGTVYSMTLQADGRLLIAGDFTAVNGVVRNRIARLNSDGSLDTGFNPGTGANNTVWSMALQADGKLLIGGAFTTVNGVALNRIARLNSDGSLDAGFNPGSGANATVRSVVLQADGKLLIGGDFTTVNSVAINRIARLNSDGLVDAGFSSGTGANGAVHSMALQADGKLLIGGVFTAVNGVARKYTARLNSDGSVDTSFDRGAGTYNTLIYSMTLQADGKLLIGGVFTTVNSVAINRIARLHTGDADADGVEDGADSFTNNSAAARDTDQDGLPDVWLQPNDYGCAVDDSTCNGLTLDTDDDNDGVPDSFDPEPSNAANVWPLDGNYRGSSVREQNQAQ